MTGVCALAGTIDANRTADATTAKLE